MVIAVGLLVVDFLVLEIGWSGLVLCVDVVFWGSELDIDGQLFHYTRVFRDIVNWRLLSLVAEYSLLQGRYVSAVTLSWTYTSKHFITHEDIDN